MSDFIHRREALRQLALFWTSLLIIPACSRKPSCQDVTGLSADQINQRQNVAEANETTLDATKSCAACVQYVPGAANACGTCKVVKGPINPEGGCKLFVAKPT